MNTKTFAQQIFCPIRPFGTIIVSPDFELDGPGRNVDSMDFWETPDPANTMLFVTAKDNSLLEVWKYPFHDNGEAPLRHATFSNSNVNGIVIDQETNLMYITIGNPSGTVSVFKLPEMDFVMNFNRWFSDFGGEPNIALLKLTNGEKRVYVSADDVVYIHDAATGKYLSKFKPIKGLETIAADYYYQRLYIPDENDHTGVYVYHPDGSPYYQNGVNRFGENKFRKDAEGIIIYRCTSDSMTDNGSGFIVISDQIAAQNEYEFFDRESWEYLGTMKIEGVSNTDGIGSFQNPLPDYPLGIFVAINDDSTTVGVFWETIFKAAGINISKYLPEVPVDSKLKSKDSS